MTQDELIVTPPYSLPAAQKDAALAHVLTDLVVHHAAHCEAYGRLLGVMAPGWTPNPRPALEELPWLPVALFKSHHLASVPEDQVFTVLTSSGTTGSTPSRVVLDRRTAQLQSRSLARIMGDWLGKARLPMLVIDVEHLLRGPLRRTARAAGVLGMMPMGRHHLFALDEHHELRLDAVRAWLDAHGSGPFLVFGFTFLVWQYLLPAAQQAGLDLSQGVLVHSGGWKKLTNQAVDRAAFRAEVQRTTGMARCHDFYGMVEQVGSVFVECEQGVLHAPVTADVIVRQPGTWTPVPAGTVGVLQVLSALPSSYPGHSLLTEDLGVVHGVDDCACGRLGRTFRVLGRAPRAAVRGCSDTHSPAAA